MVIACRETWNYSRFCTWKSHIGWTIGGYREVYEMTKLQLMGVAVAAIIIISMSAASLAYSSQTVDPGHPESTVTTIVNSTTTVELTYPAITVQTDKSQYCCSQTMNASGTVYPAPVGPGSNVAVEITNPSGNLVDDNQFQVSADGIYFGTFVLGGPLYTLAGYYTVSANYNGNTASTTFYYTSSSTSLSITVVTDKVEYCCIQTMNVSGVVSPAPGVSGTYVAVSIASPNGSLSEAKQFVVATSTGSYNGSFILGGPEYTPNGDYTVSSNYEGVRQLRQHSIILQKIQPWRVLNVTPHRRLQLPSRLTRPSLSALKQ